jgi:hypothetical protein
MKKLITLAVLLNVVGCTTIHFRSNQSIPVSFEGNPKHQKEVSIVSTRDFYFWGINPEHHEVIIDEEVRKAGYDSISKLIIYEQKNPQDILISFLTFGIYLPRGYTITGFSSGHTAPDDLGDSIQTKKK